MLVAMVLVATAPAVAQVENTFDDQEGESSSIGTNTQIVVEGDNNSSCTGLLQFSNTGNLGESQGSSQYFSGSNEVEFNASEFEFGPGSGQECEQQIQQSAAASKGEKATPEQEEKKAEVKPEAKKEEKKEEKKELPKSGGNGSASLLALGAGALLVGGGLLARRFIR